jgi:uncharacterized protein (DUF1330 family)
MPAYLLGLIDVCDGEAWLSYVEAVGPTIREAGGEVLLRGRRVATKSGHAVGSQVVVLRFPDLPALERWYGSPAYQALIPLRDKGADVTVMFYQA